MLKTLVTLVVAVLVPSSSAADAVGQSWRTLTMSRHLGNERSVNVDVQYTAGRFSVGKVEAGTLYRMQLEYDEDRFEPVAEYDGSNFRVGTEWRSRWTRFVTRDIAGEMKLALARDVSMDLEMAFGAVEADIDLGGFRLTALDIDTGASKMRLDISEPNAASISTVSLNVGAADVAVRHIGNLNAEVIEMNAGAAKVELDFTGEWQRDVQVLVDMGVGSLSLRFPKGLGVRFDADTFLSSSNLEELVKRGDTYFSLDYDDAEYRVTVDVDAAFGSVNVEWVP